MRTTTLCIFPLAVSLLSLSTACDKGDKGTTTTTAAQPTGAAATAPTIEGAKDAGATATATATATKPAVTFKGVGLATPESVLYDDVTDLYLVSNVNGQPTAGDNNGFISQLSPDGTVKTLKWIEAGKNGVKLNAPKGLALAGDLLYVADLDTIRLFDRKTGAPKGDVKVPGATFLNDACAGPDNRVYVSDSGLKAGAGGNFEPSGSDAIYAVDKDKKLATIVKSKDLGRPNGLYVAPGKIWVVTFGTGELYALDMKGAKSEPQKLPKGQLDGVLTTPTGDLLVSSWEGSTIYRGRIGQAASTFKPLIENVKSPADLGYDMKRGRVLVPHFQEDIVDAFDAK